jgi:hypothetical protein
VTAVLALTSQDDPAVHDPQKPFPLDERSMLTHSTGMVDPHCLGDLSQGGRVFVLAGQGLHRSEELFLSLGEWSYFDVHGGSVAGGLLNIHHKTSVSIGVLRKFILFQTLVDAYVGGGWGA